jgi:hypothetical protein
MGLRAPAQTCVVAPSILAIMRVRCRTVKVTVLAYLCTKTCIECDNNLEGGGGGAEVGDQTYVIGPRESGILVKATIERWFRLITTKTKSLSRSVMCELCRQQKTILKDFGDVAQSWMG